METSQLSTTPLGTIVAPCSGRWWMSPPDLPSFNQALVTQSVQGDAVLLEIYPHLD